MSTVTGGLPGHNFNAAPRVIFQTSQPLSYCNLRTPCIQVKDLIRVRDGARIQDTSDARYINLVFLLSRLCRELPPYAIEFYREVLRVWKSAKPSITIVPSLYELCLRRIGQITESSAVIPARYVRRRINHVIHRAFRRLLDRFEEACMFERTYDSFEADWLFERSYVQGFMKYPGSNVCKTLIGLWLNRGRYLKQNPCPVERAKDYMKYLAYNERMIPRNEPAEPIHEIRLHQHNYFRCKCPRITAPARQPIRIITRPKQKVSKELRAAQRAEQRARRR